ncbi:MAG TPA: hypothetical protein VN873_20480 [Candidatus Angelobacter sp.]|nr:hypothetical protein [Candidatus Angelobacter sp.]
MLLVMFLVSQTAQARFYDRFDTPDANWDLTANGGTASIANSELTLSAPAGTISNPSAELTAAQTLTGTRQSILVRSHTGEANKTVFFFWAVDTATGNMLELKINDQATTTLTAGYYDNNGGTYHFVGTMTYATGTNGIYLAFKESGGTTYWEVSTNNAESWIDDASMLDPISTSSMMFIVQHKEYAATSSTTGTTVDCFNYRANGAGYHDIQDKNYSGTDGWELYTECFTNGHYMCQRSACDDQIYINDVTSPNHFTDSTIPLPRYDDTGYHFEIISNNMLWWKHIPGTTNSILSFDNAYRYQKLAFVDADNWTYHIYFKYSYPDTIQQGLEFPINKYTGTHRLQGAVAWYPNRPDQGTHTGKWKVYSGTNWLATGFSQTFDTNVWYEVTFSVGLHDDTVFYTDFQAGPADSMTTWAWNHSYKAPGDGTSASTMPAMQMDDNTSDSTLDGTRKDLYMAEWNIDWQDEKLPATP